MLSKHGYKMLKWLDNQSRWLTDEQIKNNCKSFDEIAFSAIKKDKYVAQQMDTAGDSWVTYRINESGRAYLEGARQTKQSTFREWLALVLSIIAIIVSLVT